MNVVIYFFPAISLSLSDLRCFESSSVNIGHHHIYDIYWVKKKEKNSEFSSEIIQSNFECEENFKFFFILSLSLSLPMLFFLKIIFFTDNLNILFFFWKEVFKKLVFNAKNFMNGKNDHEIIFRSSENILSFFLNLKC